MDRGGNRRHETGADERPALSLYHRGVSLSHVERAILLGALRKYATVLQNACGTRISSLNKRTCLFCHQPVTGAQAAQEVAKAAQA